MRKKIALIATTILLAITTLSFADESSDKSYPYIGVRLDPHRLSELLTKHLGLSPGQGIRIKNVVRNSPAEKAGLERDDIIIGFEGNDVTDNEDFVEAVRHSGVGTKVSLEIVHLGHRKTVKLTLEASEEKYEWKYSPEPEFLQSWRPGKIFRLKPGDQNWNEIVVGDLPEFKKGKFFKELHTFHYSNGEDYTITIEGDPNDEDATVIVRIGDAEYKTTLREINRLPEKYRAAADEALEDARRLAREPKHHVPCIPLPNAWMNFYENWAYPHNLPVPTFGPGNEIFERVEKQMRKLQERIEVLEKHQKEMSEHPANAPKSPRPKESI